MNKQTRKFYTRYRMYTSIAPAYLTGMLVFLFGWFTYHPTAGPFGKTIEIMAGLMFFLACTGGFEVCSRLGFKQFKLNSYRAKLTPALKQQLEAAISSRSASGQLLHPRLVELGEVPMLMVGGDMPDRLWVSTYTLANTTAPDMAHLLNHEQAHLEHDTMLDRVLVTGGFWWLCGVGVMMLVGQPLLAAVWLLVASGVFLRVNAVRQAFEERRADKLAVDATTLEGYTSAMAKHLAQFEVGTNHGLVRGRLKRLGLSKEQVEALLEKNSAAPRASD